MKKIIRLRFLFVLLLLASSRIVCHATILITSIDTTTSSCGNNGTATIHASSSKANPMLLYELVSGPITAPVQSSTVFTSLFPGTYTVRVYDVDFESKDMQFSIKGNYKLPSPTLLRYNPICIGGSDGMVIGNNAPLSGTAPFNWQIIAPYVSPIQASDTFKNLPSGSYTIRVEDACGNFQTRTQSLIDDGTGFSMNGVPSVVKIGCDSFSFRIPIRMFKEKAKYPLTLTVTTNAGVVTQKVFPIPIDTTSMFPGFFSVNGKIAGVTYGDYLKLCLKDTCGTTHCAPFDTISPYEYVLNYSTDNTCSNTQIAQIQLKQPYSFPYYYTQYRYPAKMTLLDVATNTMVDSMVCSDGFCSLTTKPHTIGNSYALTVVDGCGQIFQNTIVWPPPSAPSVSASVTNGCIDSTASLFFLIKGFRKNPKIELLSGPSLCKSTKPLFSYVDNISYPKTFQFLGSLITIKNAPAGTYQYRIFDECGNSILGTITVFPTQVSSYTYKYSVKKGCIGDNDFSFTITGPDFGNASILNLSNFTFSYQRSNAKPNSTTHVPSLAPGKYIFSLACGSNNSINALTDNLNDCWVIKDTITIPFYGNKLFKASTSVFCNGTNYLELQVDSATGIPPFLYEIKSGPQTYPPQSSNLFSIPQFGNYQIRIQDACGNSVSRNISVDSTKFPPIVKNGPSCLGSTIKLSGVSSPYFEYTWTTPKGLVFVGDSILISPLSAADTGVYHVQKKVTINGCTNILHSSYRLYLFDVVNQTINLCTTASVKVGSNTYTQAGIYTDSLVNSKGCDSVVTTTVLIGYKKTTLDTTICEGQNVRVGIHTYNLAGTYIDSLVAINGCDSIVTLKLKIEKPPIVNLGKDTSLCVGQSYVLNAGAGFASYWWSSNPAVATMQFTDTIAVAGKYWVRIKTAGVCTVSDTIQLLNVYPLPLVIAQNDQTICSGSTITLTATSPTGVKYTWKPGKSSTSSIQVRPMKTTTYTVTATDIHTCTSVSDSVTIRVNQSPTTPPFESNKVLHCFDAGSITLAAKGEKYFLWSTGDTARSIEIPQQGLYSVTVSDDSGCSIKGIITVKEYCPPQLYFPSAFTPNGDNLHDDLEIFGKHFKNFDLKIFNRWGEVIFTSNDRNLRWDGMYKGEEMPAGTYECIVHYRGEYEEDTEEKVVKGSVTLIR